MKYSCVSSIVLTTLLTVMSVPILGCWHPARDLNKVPENMAAYSDSPDIAFDKFGNAFAVWAEDISGNQTTYQIFARRYSFGSGWEAVVTPLSNSSNNASQPKIAFDGLGNAFAVWLESISVGESFITNLFAARYDADTGWQATGPTLNNDHDQYADTPEIACDATGNAIVVWQETTSDGPPHVFASRYSFSTPGWSAPHDLNNASDQDAYNPDIALDASGNAIAVWEEFNPDTNVFNIFARTYNPITNIWNPSATHLNFDQQNAGIDSRVAFDGQGNAIAVWVESPDGLKYPTWARRYVHNTGWEGIDVAGQAWQLNNTLGKDTNLPQIILDYAGNAIAVWAEPTSSFIYNIYARRYVALTNTWQNLTPHGEAVNLNNETGGQVNFSSQRIAMDATGNAVAV